MQPQPGWYPDPTGRNQLRYWDGGQWTTSIANNGVVGDETQPNQSHPMAGNMPAQQQAPAQAGYTYQAQQQAPTQPGNPYAQQQPSQQGPGGQHTPHPSAGGQHTPHPSASSQHAQQPAPGGQYTPQPQPTSGGQYPQQQPPGQHAPHQPAPGPYTPQPQQPSTGNQHTTQPPQPSTGNQTAPQQPEAPGNAYAPQQQQGSAFARQSDAAPPRQATVGPHENAPHGPIVQLSQPIQNIAQQPIDQNALHGILAEAGVQPRSGDGTRTGEPVLVVEQTSMDATSGYRYDIYSSSGQLLGICVEDVTPISTDASWGAMVQHNAADRMEICDPQGNVVEQFTHRQEKGKSAVSLIELTGTVFGEVKQENVLGKLRLSLTGRTGPAPDLHPLGQLQATDMKASRLAINDAAGTQIGRMIKIGRYAKWRPLIRDAKAHGLYVVELTAQQPYVLASMISVLPVVVDLVLNPNPAGYRSLGR